MTQPPAKRLQILITASYYWPEIAGTAPYVTGMAEHLAGLGHEVRVATGFAHYPSWSGADRRLAMAETRNRVHITRRWHHVPPVQTAKHRAIYEASLYGLGLTALPGSRPDVVIGMSPSLAAGMLAATAGKLYRRPHGIIYHDLMGRGAEESGVAGGGRVAGPVKRVEYLAARSAAGIAIIADGFRDYFVEGGVTPDRIHKVRTWTLGSDAPAPNEDMREALGWERDEFVCLHAGNMGHKQGLDNLLDVAQELQGRDGPGKGVRIVLAGDGNERPHLEARSRSLGLKNLSFVDPQPAGRYEAMLRAADLLLVNQRATVREMSLPGKLTAYMPAARPVVAAVAPESETAQEIADSGAGVLVAPGEPAALVDAVLALRASDERRAELGENGVRYADRVLSTSAILEGYVRFIENVAAGR